MKAGVGARRAGAAWVVLGIFSALAPACGSDTATDSGVAGEGGQWSGAGGPGSGGTASGGMAGAGASSGGSGGEEETFLPLYESGTRLRAVYLGGVDGEERRFVAWYDAVLETECVFGRAEDGQWRCLPRGQELAPGFTDAACTQPVFYDGLVAPCETHQAFRTQAVDSDDDCTGQRVVRMEQQEGVGEVYHESCSEEPTELPEGATVWREGAVVPPSDLVQAEQMDRVGPDGVGVTEFLGEDGSRQVTGIVDAEHGACSPRVLTDAGRRCAPSDGGAFQDGDWWWADEGCTGTPLAYGTRISSCRDQAEFAVLRAESGELSVATLGDPVEGTVYEKNSSDPSQCQARQSDELLWTLYPIAEPYDGTNLLAVSSAAAGSGRVRPQHRAIGTHILTYEAGATSAYAFVDAERDEPCEAFRLAAGDWICLPETTRRVEELYFADDICTQPAAVLFATEEEPDAVALVSQVSCTRDAYAFEVHETYTVLGPHEGDVFTQVRGGDCESAGIGDDQIAYELEPTDEFALLEEDRE